MSLNFFYDTLAFRRDGRKAIQQMPEAPSTDVIVKLIPGGASESPCRENSQRIELSQTYQDTGSDKDDLSFDGSRKKDCKISKSARPGFQAHFILL